MSDINPVEYSKLVNAVENLERKVDAMEVAKVVEELCAKIAELKAK
jgi:hypothetical protein